MSIFNNKKILFLGPHADDIEFGSGGLISSINNISNIYFLTFSFSKISLIKNYTEKDVKNEVNSSAKILNVSNVLSKNYPTRSFYKFRQAILEDLVEAKKEINPDIIFTPSSHDTHQDHCVIYKESFRAFKDRTIFGYEMPLNNRSFSPDFYFKLNEYNLKKKIDSLNAYSSQMIKKDGLLDMVKATALFRGSQIGQKYAESFEVIRIIL